MTIKMPAEAQVAASTSNSERSARVVSFIGGGQMATALIAGLLRSGWNKNNILVLEPNREQRERLRNTLKVRVVAAADPSLRDADVIVWAVKPQALAQAIGPVIALIDAPLHISIAAGVPTLVLARWLRSDRVIRVMPNTPALVGAGVSGMFAMPGAAPADRDFAEDLLSSIGHSFWVDSDDRIDAVTAISGSGPGYVFQFLDCFQAAAQSLGFTKEQARELVLRTATGALAQAGGDDTPFSILRDRVTSKGGTTAAGLARLAEYQLPDAVTLAVGSAYQRAKELSRAVEIHGKAK